MIVKDKSISKISIVISNSRVSDPNPAFYKSFVSVFFRIGSGAGAFAKVGSGSDASSEVGSR